MAAFCCLHPLCLSTLDGRASALAREHGTGLELTQFCDPLEARRAGAARQAADMLSGLPFAVLHAPYYELTPCAIDPEIGRVSLLRYREALALCVRLGIRRMVVHSGFIPTVYHRDWFLPKSAAFWKTFARELPRGFTLLIENVLDPDPETLKALIDRIDHPQVRLCLDTGHARVYGPCSETKWLDALKDRVAHVHLHDNLQKTDDHLPLGQGNMDTEAFLDRLVRFCPDASITLESPDALSSLRYLQQKGWLRHE